MLDLRSYFFVFNTLQENKLKLFHFAEKYSNSKFKFQKKTLKIKTKQNKTKQQQTKRQKTKNQKSKTIPIITVQKKKTMIISYFHLNI